MAGVRAPEIITCSQWHAARPKAPIVTVGRPDKIIFHHTAGHAQHSSALFRDELEAEAHYAWELQQDMQMRRGWDDSGHSFLVMRSGRIFQGRWGTVAAIERGRMVESAHCPGQNGNPGIEHEHVAGEDMTSGQRSNSVWLMAWICDRCKISPTAIYGHDAFYPTDCPSNLASAIPSLRVAVASTINSYGRSNGRQAGIVRTRLAVGRELRA